MRLIDADELRKCAIPCEIHNGALTDLCVPLYQIDNAPTVDMDERDADAFETGYIKGICESRPQGEWIERNIGEGIIVHECSNCGNTIDVDYEDLAEGHFAFCDKCGADMRKGETDA